MAKLKGEFKRVRLKGSFRIPNQIDGFRFYLTLNDEKDRARFTVHLPEKDSDGIFIELPELLKPEDWPEIYLGLEEAIDSLNLDAKKRTKSSFLNELFILELRKKDYGLLSVAVKWYCSDELVGEKVLSARRTEKVARFEKCAWNGAMK